MSQKEYFPGIHTVSALLNHQPERIQLIWLEQNKSNPRIDTLIEQARAVGITVQIIQRNKLDQLCGSTQHQGIVASCTPASHLNEDELLRQLQRAQDIPLLLILDEVSDPHNLGACLRTAEAAGVSAVIIPQNHCAPLNAIVHKISSGATVRLPIVKTSNLSRFIARIKKLGIWVYGADGHAGQTLYESNLTHPTAIIMGAEDQGLRRLTRERCDQLYSLPMHGEMESLNVSVATGIFLYEAVRQRSSR